MWIDNESQIVDKGDVVVIPPRSNQHIESIGKVDLEFVCIVEPGWTPECEEILS